MPESANHSDDERLAAYGAALADALEAALPGWVERCVRDTATAAGAAVDDHLLAEARAAGGQAQQEVGPVLRALLAMDPDAQPTGPLAVVRDAVRYPTEVLARAGVPVVGRDSFAVRAFPADVYALAPAAFVDLDPSVHEPGLVWGAAKAHVVLGRRRAEGEKRNL